MNVDGEKTINFYVGSSIDGTNKVLSANVFDYFTKP